MQLQRSFYLTCALAFAALVAQPVYAQSVKVGNAWVRATAPGQKTAGAYVDVTSDSNAALVAVGSPVAARAELHSMSTEGGVMRMRALPRIDLPAGQTVKLTPGGMHVMLIDVKQPLKAGDKVPLVLSVQSSGMSLTTVKLEAEVRTAPPEAPSHGHH
jgi:copper(I)-binding protein